MAQRLQIESTVPSSSSSTLDKKIRATLAMQGVTDELLETQSFGITYRSSPSGPILGGIMAFVHGSYLQISILWNSDTVRGKGVGTHLIRYAECEGLKRGCTAGALVDTFGFQAEGFYLKQGFKKAVEVEGAFEGRTSKIYLVKSSLSPEAMNMLHDPHYELVLEDAALVALKAILIEGLELYGVGWNYNWNPLFISRISDAAGIQSAAQGSSNASMLIIDRIWFDSSSSSVEEVATECEAILQSAEDEGRKRGCWAMIIFAFDYAGAPSIEVYAQRGFQGVHSTPGWYGNRYSRFILYKNLNDTAK